MIDTHAHLNELAKVEEALERARAVGLTGIVAVGMDLSANRLTLELARSHPDFIFPAIGYHPWALKPEEVEENLTFIREHLAECVALGEVGLDYQAKPKKRLQQQVFRALLEIAAQHHRPVIVHTRFSQHRAHALVKEAGVEKAVFHWYSGPLEVLGKILADGFFISATPALSYSPPHQAAVAAAPLSRILLETDAPVEYQGKVSEPADLMWTAREVSRIKEVPLKEVIQVTTANAREFFGI